MPIEIAVTVDDPDALIVAAVDALEKNERGIDRAVEILWGSEVERLNAGNFPPALKPDTIKRKRAKGQPEGALVATGTMRDTLKKTVQGNDGYLRATQFYGWVQQYGSGRLPARKWMFVAPEDDKRVTAEFEKELMERPGLARLKNG